VDRASPVRAGRGAHSAAGANDSGTTGPGRLAERRRPRRPPSPARRRRHRPAPRLANGRGFRTSGAGQVDAEQGRGCGTPTWVASREVPAEERRSRPPPPTPSRRSTSAQMPGDHHLGPHRGGRPPARSPRPAARRAPAGPAVEPCRLGVQRQGLQEQIDRRGACYSGSHRRRCSRAPSASRRSAAGAATMKATSRTSPPGSGALPGGPPRTSSTPRAARQHRLDPRPARSGNPGSSPGCPIRPWNSIAAVAPPDQGRRCGRGRLRRAPRSTGCGTKRFRRQGPGGRSTLAGQTVSSPATAPPVCPSAAGSPRGFPPHRPAVCSPADFPIGTVTMPAHVPHFVPGSRNVVLHPWDRRRGAGAPGRPSGQRPGEPRPGSAASPPKQQMAQRPEGLRRLAGHLVEQRPWLRNIARQPAPGAGHSARPRAGASSTSRGITTQRRGR